MFSVDERWKGTQNALAGLLCALLGSMDAERTTSPARAFPPHGSLPLLRNHSYALRHAHLPSENVYTENLEPFSKLLPCPAKARIAILLNSHKLCDADWHGLGINVVWKEGGMMGLGMTVQAVFDPVRTSPDGKCSELLSIYYLDYLANSTIDWSLRSIFGRTIERACSVTTSSNVELTSNGVEGYTLAPTPTVDWSAEQVKGVEGYFYELKSVAHPDALSDLDLSMRWTGDGKFAYRKSRLLLIA